MDQGSTSDKRGKISSEIHREILNRIRQETLVNSAKEDGKGLLKLLVPYLRQRKDWNDYRRYVATNDDYSLEEMGRNDYSTKIDIFDCPDLQADLENLRQEYDFPEWHALHPYESMSKHVEDFWKVGHTALGYGLASCMDSRYPFPAKSNTCLYAYPTGIVPDRAPAHLDAAVKMVEEKRTVNIPTCNAWMVLGEENPAGAAWLAQKPASTPLEQVLIIAESVSASFQRGHTQAILDLFMIEDHNLERNMMADPLHKQEHMRFEKAMERYHVLFGKAQLPQTIHVLPSRGCPKCGPHPHADRPLHVVETLLSVNISRKTALNILKALYRLPFTLPDTDWEALCRRATSKHQALVHTEHADANHEELNNFTFQQYLCGQTVLYKIAILSEFNIISVEQFRHLVKVVRDEVVHEWSTWEDHGTPLMKPNIEEPAANESHTITDSCGIWDSLRNDRFGAFWEDDIDKCLVGLGVMA